jgi:hypothetical protein
MIGGKSRARQHQHSEARDKQTLHVVQHGIAS